MHKEVKVDFIGDKVLDAGGLLREWLLLLFIWIKMNLE